MELWDLYTYERKLTGEQHVRGEKIAKDRYHLVVHVIIKNKDGKYLISQRSADKPTYPLMWEVPGGSVIKGENSLQGALREVYEEVGIKLEPSNGKVKFTEIHGAFDGETDHYIKDVWQFDYNGEADLNAATTKEVNEVKWMTIEEIRKLCSSNKMICSLQYFV